MSYSFISQNSLGDTQNEAAEGLLRLRDSYPSTPSIHPLQPIPDYNFYQLPPISNLLLSTSNTSPSLYQHYNNSWNSWESSSKILYSPSDDSSSTTYSYPYSQPISSTATLIEPLASSSIRSTKGSHSLKMASSKKKETFLSRAATFTRRRGRPRKNVIPTPETPIYDEGLSIHTGSNFSTTPSPIKPRWQDAEKRELIEAIVKEKNLDDMASIRWDRISMTVGRAKKACKDQWRRVLLPDLLKRTDSDKYEKRQTKTIHRID